jgi:hypothetical protein
MLARRRFRRRVAETIVIAILCVALGWAMTRM